MSLRSTQRRLKADTLVVVGFALSISHETRFLSSRSLLAGEQSDTLGLLRLSDRKTDIQG